MTIYFIVSVIIFLIAILNFIIIGIWNLIDYSKAYINDAKISHHPYFDSYLKILTFDLLIGTEEDVFNVIMFWTLAILIWPIAITMFIFYSTINYLRWKKRDKKNRNRNIYYK